MRSSNVTHSVLAVVFLLIIFSGLLLFVISEKETVNKVENRQLAVMPSLDINNLDPFPRKYDDYYSDHFPFRSVLVHGFNEYNYDYFGISPMPDKVVTGTDGFLFMANDQLETYQGKNLFNEAELKSVVDELKYRRDYCNERGIKFYFVILPQKHSIYGEYLPRRYRVSPEQPTIRTQLEAALKADNFDFLDLTDTLLAKKTGDHPVYYRTDNHWNTLGAFYGTRAILERVHEDFPAVRVPDINEFIIREEQRNAGNLGQMLDLEDHITDIRLVMDRMTPTSSHKGNKVPYTPTEGFAYVDEYEQVFENPEANEVKALIIRESFANSQREFYADAFGKTVLIWDRWQYALNEPIIENEKPDLMVIQMLESQLPKLRYHQSR